MQKQKILWATIWGICSGVVLAIQPAAAEESGVWESTKGVAADTWDGTKNVASDVWDGTKNVAGDVKEGVTGEETPNANQDKMHKNHNQHHDNHM